MLVTLTAHSLPLDKSNAPIQLAKAPLPIIYLKQKY